MAYGVSTAKGSRCILRSAIDEISPYKVSPILWCKPEMTVDCHFLMLPRSSVTCSWFTFIVSRF